MQPKAAIEAISISGFIRLAILIVKKPFPRSDISVSSANNLLPVLKTLVAPMFPDPVLRMSLPPLILLNTSPLGKLPRK